MRLSLILFGAIYFGAFAAQAQESTGRLSVAPVATAPAASPAPATTPAPTPTQPPVAKAPEPTSNVVDAPLPEIANQPKVITPSQSSTPDGPKGPRDGRWYVAGGAGAMVQQFISSGTATVVGTPPLNQTDSGNLGFYAEGKVGYDFAVRDVQLAFGGPTPMRTAMELEFGYLGSYEKIPLQNGTTGVGTETYNLSSYAVMLNGLIKFEDLPITPYFGGGVGASTLYSYNHKIVVDGYTGANEVYNTTTSVNNANNVCLALQAIVGLERQLYQGLSMYVEYKFLAFMDVNFSYGNTGWNPSKPDVAPGSNNSNNFLAQQIISSGLKWSF
jgi:opacity protein-like surface antigen